MESLDTLELCGCSRLTSIGPIASLTELRITGCHMLQTLPGLKGMRSLQELYIEWCEELRQLPDSISHLTELSRLILRGLPAMKALPEGLCGLKSLQVLNVKMCGIVSLSSRMQRLTALRNVELNDCEQLAALPAGLGQVPLDTLVLSSCGRLQSIQGNWKKACASLSLVSVHMCSKLRSMPQCLRKLVNNSSAQCSSGAPD